MTEQNFEFDSMIKQLDKIDNKESLEYIYMDDIQNNSINLQEIFDDCFLITRNKNNELVMMDTISTDEKTLLSFIPEVDLMIINNKLELPSSILEEMISEHTIILKIFNKIFYMEDHLKNEIHITTENDSLKILDNGIYTRITREDFQRL
ncbi:MAG: hypothetical protein BZ137_01880 [Methanosphaera sp. rholeuAM130]|nr:hypothetical protein [Methanosphaera sp.]RAP54491.1 MAG: hypothetical protein BZ137_01880 [Methanosphaera sp. rholeuAM130]